MVKKISHGKATALINHTYQPPKEFAAPQANICKASTIFFPNMAEVRKRDWKDKSGYTYGLHGTPTSFILEEKIATLEGGKQCVLLPSGLAAIAQVGLAILNCGDEVLVPDNAYGPSKAFAEGDLKRFGVTYKYYDPMDYDDFKSKITEKTKLIWLEAAGSVTLEFPDLIKLVKTCKEKKIICALDNTWGAGIAFNPFDLDGTGLGVDISAHALTKYPSGTADILMGSITTVDENLHMKIKLSHMRIGFGVGMDDVATVLKGLPTVYLRYNAADITTRKLAKWCEQQKEFIQIMHPALSQSAGHDNWKKISCKKESPNLENEGGAASIFSVILDEKYTQKQVDDFCNALKIFKIAFSWGGPVSLVMSYELKEMREKIPANIKSGHIVRFAIGLEDYEDLRADIENALKILR